MVTLQPVQRGDAELIFDAWGNCADNFTFLTAPVFESIADAEYFIHALFPTPASEAFHIIDPAAGAIGIVKAAITGHGAQVGYVVHKPFWGRGIATSAVSQVLERLEARRDLSRIWATCAIDNVGSARVLEKCGFDREGVLRNWVVYPARGGRAFDNYSYVRIPR